MTITMSKIRSRLLGNKIGWFKFFRWSKTAVGFVLLVILATTAVAVPTRSQAADNLPIQPIKLAQQGREYYEAGQLNQAIQAWQQAAVAYEAAEDVNGSRESYLNTATAQQVLGLYDRSCTSLLSAFELTERTSCGEIIEQAQTIEPQLEGIVPIRKQGEAQLLPTVLAISKQPDTVDKAVGLLRFGDYLRVSGYPQVAAKALELGLIATEKLNNPAQQSATLIGLGNAERAIAIKRQNQFPSQTIVLDAVVNAGGTVESALSLYQPALTSYQRAAEIASSQADGLKAELNQLRLLLDIQEFWLKAIADLNQNLDFLEIGDPGFLQQIREGSSSLEQELQQLEPQIIALTNTVEPQVINLPPSREGIYQRIDLAKSLIRQDRIDRNTGRILATAIEQSRKINNVTAEAEAMGYLGSLYELQGQYAQARRLTEGTLQLAPTAEYPQIAYRWNARLGRILAAQGRRDRALIAYQTSWNTIKALRSDLATTSVESILREYISLLLAEEPSSSQLVQARDVLETLQVVTLDNFFRDPCSEVAQEPVAIDDVDLEAAVIYPILLPDSLEIILSLPKQPLRHYTIPNLNPEQVARTIRQLRRHSLTNPGFAEAIRGARGNPEAAIKIKQIQLSQSESLQQHILPLASELYKWLIAPAAAELQANDIKTLVFVLDGALRNIPMSLLYDQQEQKYLIENYNIALSSGLQLTAPKPLNRQPIKVLAAGVTKDFPAYRFPPIPQVEQELATIKEIFERSQILLNQEFTQASLEQKLQESDFPVVHLATHGQFGSTPAQTFILSGAEQGSPLINVNQFDNMLRSGSLKRAKPIELLVLSACNTAQGDNQAILGLAGVAVRAGARSTIATLWGADDQATANLMSKFYHNLAADAQISKTAALRQAQLELLTEEDALYRHPYYWAPFVLIGNWL
ncbi:CHAT domain-containing protein [Pleurocapsales cyanobacterium LEGE 10410]|nr:CHAT domain-containing protein [Pleurocapsales cyanobacterium LEGE 10410]